MRKEYIVRRVKAKLNLKKKLKDLKNKMIKKKYTSLTEENAVSYVRDIGKTHYWGFDVESKPKVTKRTYRGVSVMDVAITPKEKSSLGDEITVWLDPILGKLYGDYKVSFTQHAKHKPKFQFTPLTEESAIDYVKTVGEVEINKSKKIKKVKQDNLPMMEVPIKSGDHESTFTVWYDPGYMGLYGEW